MLLARGASVDVMWRRACIRPLRRLTAISAAASAPPPPPNVRELARMAHIGVTDQEVCGRQCCVCPRYVAGQPAVQT